MMHLTRLQTTAGSRWGLDGHLLKESFQLALLLEIPADQQKTYFQTLITDAPADGAPLAPIDATQEVWASGVTFLRSRVAREAESTVSDVYQLVYEAERPELFFKALGWRVVGPDAAIRIRSDSSWNVPEPELTLLLDRYGVIRGYCAGNDVSSRSIEGENPLYLPQAKVYNGSCALGPHLFLFDEDGQRDSALSDLPIRLDILRSGAPIFQGETSTKMMKRALPELAEYLFRELDFPQGAFLMTGTGIVPPEAFTLQPGDEVQVRVGDLLLQNTTA
jgi:2-dehydro-3-deoxy-D-arabinonate dehydratase